MIKNLLSKRIIKSSLLGIIMAVVFAVSFALASIPLGSNFQLNSQLPLDARTVVADITARDAIPSGQRYRGLTVYVLSDSTNYQLQAGITNGDWIALADAGGSMIYPGAGIAVSNGSSWSASIANNSANWNTAYGWGDHSIVGYVTGTPWTGLGYITDGNTGWDNSYGFITSLNGAVLTDQTTPQTVGDTTNRLLKLWATDITVTNAITGSITGNAGTVTNGVYTNAANSFSLINPLTTISESWIGPSSTNGIYFKGGNVGIGNTNPLQKLDVAGNINLNTNGTNVLFSTYQGANSSGLNIWIGGGGQSSVGDIGDTFLGSRNTAIGYNALLSNTTGSYNTATGYASLEQNTTGQNNSAYGTRSLRFNTTGSENTAIGNTALAVNTTGNTNSAVGHAALNSNTTGSNNTAFGHYSLFVNTIGSSNVGIGVNALNWNSTGSYNIALGQQALGELGQPVPGGAFNIGTSYTIQSVGTTDFTLVGAASNTVGVVFTATGVGSGDGTATANNLSNNIGIGYRAGQGIESGINNTIIGSNIGWLPENLSNTVILANGNSEIFAHNFALPGTDGLNTFIGVGSGNLTMTGSVGGQGSENTGIGYQALNENTTGYRNTATGRSALRFNTTGYLNVANGGAALRNNTTGTHNTAIGDSTLYANISGWANTAIGMGALSDNTTGTYNTVIGYNTGRDIITGINNTILGANLTGLPADLSNTVIIADGTGAIFAHNFGLSGTDGFNTFVGINSGNLSMTGSVGTQGSYNTGIGFLSLNSNTTGESNTAVGYGVLRYNTTGSNNVGYGGVTLRNNTTGDSNTAVGFSALYSNITGNLNEAFGHYALVNNTTGSDNIGLGQSTLNNNTTGSKNIAIGNETLRTLDITTNDGSGNNTAIGTNTGLGIITGINNTILGANVTGLPADLSNTVILANGNGEMFAHNFGLPGTDGFNTFVGINSGNLTMTGSTGEQGSYNTGIGFLSLNSNTTGNGNTATGYGVLRYNTTGSNNVGYGGAALRYNTTGDSNTAVGRAALYLNTTGSKNVANGYAALLGNITGNNNVATGDDALVKNTTGNNNVADGSVALTFNLIGNNNTAIGARSFFDLGVPQLADTLNNGTSYIITSVGTTDFTAIGAVSNTVGEVFTATGPGTGDGTASFNISTDNNTALGYGTGGGIITGVNNTILGANVIGLPADLSNTVILADGTGAIFAHNFALPGTDGFNTFVGVGSGNLTMTGSVGLEGSRNTAVGYESLPANTKGNLNTAMGYRALFSNTEGYENTAIGYRALESNIDMSANTAVGYKALLSLNTAQANTAVGHNALTSNISGNDNTAVGYYALLDTTTGGGNVAMGTNTLLENTTGGGNVAIGNSAGYNLIVPLLNNTNNVFIGNNSNSSVDGIENSMALGYLSQVTKSDQVVIGNTSVTETLLRGNVGIGTTAPGELLSLGTAGTTKGVLSLAGVTSGKIIIQPADVAGSYTLTLPTTVGGAGQVLTDIAGDGVLGWTSGGGGFTDPMTTAGDIIIRDATNTTTRLGAGGAGQVLTSDGTNISWEDPAGVSGAQTPWLSDINAAGYTLFGNNTASGNLTLDSTSDGVKGNVLINPTGGMVGIGTVNPLTNIEVYGTDAGIIVHHDGNSRGGIWALSDQRLAFAQTAASDDLVFGYGDAPVTSANFVERMRVVSSTGNVGIGTTVPEGRLHIFREQVANGDDFYGPELILTRFWDDNTNTRATSIYNYYNNTTSNDQLVLGVTGDGGATTNPSLYDNAKMVIQANGYVGIGTTIPAQILDVAGNININADSAYMYDGTNVITALPSSDNYFFGNSGNLTMTGGSNLSSGGGAFSNNTTGEWNVAYGAGSLLNNTTGNNNIGIGLESLNVNTTGTSNIAIGVYTLKDLDITDGSGNNTAIGVNTGRGIVTGINNTIIGANVTGLDLALSNNIIIADGDGNQRINVNSSGNVGIGTTDPQKRLEINDDDANTTTSGLRFTDFACTGDDKLTVGAGGDIICATDQTDGGGTGNVIDTLTATLGAGNDAGALDITNIGRLYTALGSEGLPAFSFQADTDIGMWSSASNILNFSTDATERMRIDDLGNVGIGTTAPEEMLNVMKNGGVGTRAGIYLQGLGDSYASVKLGSLATFSEFLVSAGNANNTFGGFEIRDTNENATRLAIANTSGNVGIGTNTPGVLLEVFGVSNKLGLTYSNNEYGPVGAELNSDINGDLHINALESGTVVAPRNIFLADNGGKVGIGTTNPTNILSVGDDLFTLDPKTISVGNTTGDSSVMIGQDGGTNFGYLRWNYDVIPTNTTFDIQTGNNQPILVNGYGGKVGIGNTAPSTMLTVGTDTTNTGDITVYGTGTTCIIGDGTGGTSCTSDMRLKENIVDLESELSNIMALRPISFNWKNKTRDQVDNMGLIAQEVQSIYPNVVRTIYDDYLGIDYTTLVVPAIKAIQELNLNLEGIAGNITPLEGSLNETFVNTFFNNLKTTISTWLADATNGIGNLFADVFNAKEKICIDGECLTKDDVRALLLLVHPDGSSTEEEEPVEENPLPEEGPAVGGTPVDEAPDEEVPPDDPTPAEEVETDPAPVDEAPNEDPAPIEKDPAPEETPTP